MKDRSPRGEMVDGRRQPVPKVQRTPSEDPPKEFIGLWGLVERSLRGHADLSAA